MEFPKVDPLLRFPQIKELTGLSRSTIYRLEHSGQFPKRVCISKIAVGWRTIEIAAWMDSLGSK